MCISCKRQDSPSCNQPMAPLPGLRVKPTSIFSVVGIDHAGLIYCADFPNRKFDILLFVCAVVRAVHLELVESVLTQDAL